MNLVLQEAFSTMTVRSNDGAELPLSSHISAEEGHFLGELIEKTRPRMSIEIGFAYGISSLFICEALARVGTVKHHIVDPNQTCEWKGIGLSNLKRAGYDDLIELHEKPSCVALPELISNGLQVEFAFVDGWHVFDQIILDFFYLDRMLSDGGIICFDDANWPSTRKAIRYILTNRNYSVIDCLRAPHSKRAAIRRFLRPASQFAKALVKPEISAPDEEFDLVTGSRCVALTKLGGDDREIIFHREF